MLREGGAGRLWSVAGFLRPHVALQASAYVFVGAHLSGARSELISNATLTAALAVALTVSFGFVINDYADREIDRFEKPTRALPSGTIKPAEARLLGVFIAAAAVAAASQLGEPLRLLVWLNLGLTAAYSLWLKRTVLLGNTVIAGLNSSIILFGALAGSGLSPLVWSIAGTTFVFSLAQEVLYTVADRVGDQRAGIVTTAIYLGARRSLTLFRVLLSVAALSSILPLWIGSGTRMYVLLLIPCTLMPVVLWLIPVTLKGDAAAVNSAVTMIKRVRASSIIPLLFLRPSL